MSEESNNNLMGWVNEARHYNKYYVNVTLFLL